MRHIVNTLTMSTLLYNLGRKTAVVTRRPEMSEKKEGIERLLGLIDI